MTWSMPPFCGGRGGAEPADPKPTYLPPCSAAGQNVRGAATVTQQSIPGACAGLASLAGCFTPAPSITVEIDEHGRTWLGATPSGLEALEAICLAKKSSFAAADASNWLRVYSDLAPPKGAAGSFSCTTAQCSTVNPVQSCREQRHRRNDTERALQVARDRTSVHIYSVDHEINEGQLLRQCH